MALTVDARGLACPQPVLLTRDALQQSDAVLTIVDNETAQQNVTRMAESVGFETHAERRKDGIYLHIGRRQGAQPAAAPQVGRAEVLSGPLVLIVPSEYMGRGDDPQLGEILIRAFFHTLGEVEPLPDTIIFLNSGVKLVVEGSPVVEDLDALCSRGVSVLACGTCLNHYELKDKVAVGEVSNMYTIAETMLRADKVVSL